MIHILIKYRIPAAIFFFVMLGIFLFTETFISRLGEAGFIPWITLIILLIFWIIVFVDMVRFKIYNKTFWILFMFLLPYLAPVIYLFQRKKLRHLYENKFNQK